MLDSYFAGSPICRVVCLQTPWRTRKNRLGAAVGARRSHPGRERRLTLKIRFGDNWHFPLSLSFSRPSLRAMPRPDGRASDQIRPLSFTPNFAPHATGSVLIATGDTRVICSAMIEESVP